MIDLHFMEHTAQEMGRLMAGVKGKTTEEDNNPLPPNADVDVIFHFAPAGVDVHLLTGKARMFFASFFRLKPWPTEDGHESLTHNEWDRWRLLLERKGVKYAQA